MRRSDIYIEAEKKYGNVRLCYGVTSSRVDKEMNAKSYDDMVDALAAVGVRLRVSDNILTLSINPTEYVRKKERQAGRRTKITRIISEDGRSGYEAYKYSDIVLMMQTMTDAEIYTKIGMKPATYYRHKKRMKESDYFAGLDMARMTDQEYLRSFSEDRIF